MDENSDLNLRMVMVSDWQAPVLSKGPGRDFYSRRRLSPFVFAAVYHPYYFRQVREKIKSEREETKTSGGIGSRVRCRRAAVWTDQHDQSATGRDKLVSGQALEPVLKCRA